MHGTAPRIHTDPVSETSLRRTEEQLQILHELAVSLLHQASVDDVVREIARGAVEQLGFEDCVVYILDRKRSVLVQRAARARGHDQDDVAYRRIEIPLGSGIVGAAARSGEILIIDDVAQDPRYIVDDQPRRSEVAVPITFEGEVIGLIDSENSAVAYFTADRVAMVRTLAALVATRLYVELGREEYEAELRLAHEEARDAVHLKDEFLANVSHEVRTPLVGILGVTRLLKQRVEEQAAAAALLDLIDILQRSGSHLLAIVQQLLDVAALQNTNLESDLGPVSPLELLTGVSGMFRPKAASAGVQLETEVCGEIPPRIHSDATRLRQILVNLVDNAIKFTPQGGVVRVVLEDVQPGMFSFTVEDTGIGIEPADQARIFESFATGGSRSGETKHGVGLGLAIARRLAVQLGGTLVVRSASGKGSAFQLQVPVDPRQGLTAPDSAAAELAPPLAPRPGPAVEAAPHEDGGAGTRCGRILLAEDNQDTRRLIEFHLSEAGHEVHSVADGAAALDLAMSERASGREFDAVLLDMAMPRLDGFTVARRLRGVGYRGEIVALTAHALPRDRKRCLEAGCSHYFAKPFDWNDLLQLVATAAAPPQ